MITEKAMYFDNKMTSIYHSKVETLDYFVCLTSLENKQPKQTNNTQAKAKHKQKTKTKNKQTNKQTSRKTQQQQYEWNFVGKRTKK